MDDLVTWLRAQLDDDERTIAAACLHIDDCSDSAFTSRGRCCGDARCAGDVARGRRP